MIVHETVWVSWVHIVLGQSVFLDMPATAVIFPLFCCCIFTIANAAYKMGSLAEENDFLMMYGYIPDTSKVATIVTRKRRRDAIRNFQRMAGIQETGAIDTDTKKMMRAPRCGMPDMDQAPSSHPSGPDNYILIGDKWKKRSLRWTLTKPSNNLSVLAQRRALTNAFAYWSKVSGIDIRETQGGADIKVSFEQRDHKDGYEFDGEGGILAHAFYPEDGRMHFDNDELWTEYSKSGVNLKIVAAHEIGHILGIRHSDVRGSVMSPFYQGYKKDFNLKDDDIRAAQKLYGSNGYQLKPTRQPITEYSLSTKSNKETTTKPIIDVERMPNVCKMKFDDIFQMEDGATYVVRNQWIYKLAPDLFGVDSDWPKQSSHVFEHFPDNPDAMTYSSRYRRLYAFKGDLVWRYSGYRLERGYPRKMLGQIPDIKSAFTVRDKVLLIASKSLYVFDERTTSLKRSGPLRSQFRKAPYGAEAALTDQRPGYDAVYLFRGPRYYKYRLRDGSLLPGYPHSKSKRWMQC